MATPLALWLQTRNAHLQKLPLELALEIAEKLDSPEDIVNFALACRAFLDYWLHLTETLQQRRPHEEDPESNPPVHPPVQDGTIEYNPTRVDLFQAYSKRTIQRLFSPETRRLIMLILFMPNSSHRVYDIEFRRNYPQVGDPSPFPLLFERRTERFNMYYAKPEYQDLLFTFKNLNRVSPYSKAIHQFATDFAKKALSSDANLAHHSFPSFAHQSLSLDGPDSRYTASLRDASPIQDLNQLHETERERLLLAFYQYEAMCTTSAKVTGYWEIRRAVDVVVQGGRLGLNGWNAERTFQSPIAGQSCCQIERVVCVYHYVRLQYLLIFNALFAEYRNNLEQATMAAEALGIDGSKSPWGPLVPAIFANSEARLEWIDVLCSKGCLFLHEILSMNGDRRREFFCRTYYPTRVSPSRFLLESEYLIKGIFHTLDNRLSLNKFTYSDVLGDAGGQNLAWLSFNHLGLGQSKNTTFTSEGKNPLRRRGWVFWNAERCRALGLENQEAMVNSLWDEPNSLFLFPHCLDSEARLGHTEGKVLYPKPLPNIAWLKARELFMTPADRPCLVEFGVLGETWRIGEEKDAQGGPILPSYSFQ